MTHLPPDAPPAPHTRRWLWWTFGSCGGAVLLVIIGVIILIAVIAHNSSTSNACLPRDLPIQPGMTRTTSIRLGGSCTEIFHTGESQAEIEHYYRWALNRHGWHVLSQRSGVITFERQGAGHQEGEVQVISAAGQRRVTIAYAGS